MIGNHDGGETEQSDDREQVSDNFFLDHRFVFDIEAGRTSVEPGLCYSFDVGALVDFVAVDTTGRPRPTTSATSRTPSTGGSWPRVPDRGGRTDGQPVWHIPFSHHPPYCAGPSHHNDRAMIDELLPLYRRAGVRIVLAGHEHNFQWSEIDGLHVLVTGCGAKLREQRPQQMVEAHPGAGPPKPTSWPATSTATALP